MNEANILNFELGPENELQLVKHFKSFQRQYLAVYLLVMGMCIQEAMLGIRLTRYIKRCGLDTGPLFIQTVQLVRSGFDADCHVVFDRFCQWRFCRNCSWISCRYMVGKVTENHSFN